MKVKFCPQHDQMDCGPACLVMIASAYKKEYALQTIRERSFLTKEGVSLLGISDAARSIGFEPTSVKVPLEHLKNLPLPCILHWKQNHFVVLYEIKQQKFSNRYLFKIADPGYGLISLNQENFLKSWAGEYEKGIALILEPSTNFTNYNPPKISNPNILNLLTYLKPFKKQVFNMSLCLLLGSLITVMFPFLTQYLVDKGVTAKNQNFVTLLLLGELVLFGGLVSIEIIRNRILLYVATKVNIEILSAFLSKLLSLPLRFFDTKLTGDFIQRVQDHDRIEHFLTSQSLLTLFSLITFSAFFGVMAYYDIEILLVYLILTALSILWIKLFLNRRRILDYYKFQQRSENQEAIYEIIKGVTEIKLNQFETYKKKNWEKIQQKLFEINLRIQKTDQYQLSGFELINQFKNILITFLAATAVIKGKLSLGSMLSISFITGQMNAPITQFVNFIRSLQDAKLSMERLNSVQNLEAEDAQIRPDTDGKLTNSNSGISIKNLSFQYEGPMSPYVLKNIDLFIPHGKITAIVGASGSGKSTLLKLLLKFYEPTSGCISLDNCPYEDISISYFRKNFGVVMQDGFIFSDTIERNIATSEEAIDQDKLNKAVKISNIKDFIESLPLKYKTKIGDAGNGISGGQKQRILIARVAYKDPSLILFDEATSSLDANNEKVIMDNLNDFFVNKTVIIIAHRLSTVKNADQIIVLDDGEIVEIGNHHLLTNKKGKYYELVKNQLELGN
ncbi:ATP-binding cassette subfamily B protein [Mucilaginibacter gracilis]|uniref:ATP-binding cassette subfamily B protein n=1 Tax=Mucilaginibacter gracilis TaxID=423350 RepID=A0A495IWZ3_9SPHI|nr:peptidase domain-containing ABC transporter [Mucilaginibacter gracilis]RKR80554.1 ATP-binding cassette subfamily B protein [Mucilaginibacter gracilis]